MALCACATLTLHATLTALALLALPTLNILVGLSGIRLRLGEFRPEIPSDLMETRFGRGRQCGHFCACEIHDFHTDFIGVSRKRIIELCAPGRILADKGAAASAGLTWPEKDDIVGLV